MNGLTSTPPFPSPVLQVDTTGQKECHECKEKYLPMMTVSGPWAFDDKATPKHFCCVHCFWVWIDRVIKDRDNAGRLDRKINWE